MPSSSASPDKANSSAPTTVPIDEMIARLDGDIVIKELWKHSSRMGISAEQFERLTGASPHRLRRGRGGDQPAESSQLPSFKRCARVFRRVVTLCNGDEQAARTWLNSPAPVLKNKKPIEAAETSPGSKNVEALISQLEKAAGTA